MADESNIEINDGTVEITTNGDGETIITPSPFSAISIRVLSVAVFLCLLPFIWLSPLLSQSIKMGWSVGAAVMLTVVQQIIVWIHTEIKSLGPYLTIKKGSLHLRHGRVLLRDEISHIQIVRTKEITGDGIDWAWTLQIICNDDRQLIILQTSEKRSIDQVKAILETWQQDLTLTQDIH